MYPNGFNILLVEDNPSDAELTIRAFKKKNLANNLIHLKNGAEALDYIFAQGVYSKRDASAVPKVILLDLNMPKIGGIEVLKKLREHEATKNIPVVVLTSSTEDPDISTCYALGVNSYIVKPVNFDNFSKAVSELGFFWLLLNQVPHDMGER
jgi:two-component system, response regulator